MGGAGGRGETKHVTIEVIHVFRETWHQEIDQQCCLRTSNVFLVAAIACLVRTDLEWRERCAISSKAYTFSNALMQGLY